MGWGNVIGAAIGATASHIEGYFNRRHNSKEARSADARAYDSWRSQLLNGPKLERQGLIDAGYNPMLAITGGLSSPSIPSAHSGATSSIPDVVGSARQGAEIGKDIEKLWKEQKKQAEIKTNSDEKSLEILDVQKKKIEAETETIKSQEWRNWVSTVGGLTGNATEALLLYDFAKRNILRNGPFGSNPIGFKPNTPLASGVEKLAPLLKSSAKYGSLGIGLGLGATGIYYGLNNGLQRDSPTKNGYFKRDNDRKSQGGYYPHGNWSR